MPVLGKVPGIVLVFRLHGTFAGQCGERRNWVRLGFPTKQNLVGSYWIIFLYSFIKKKGKKNVSFNPESRFPLCPTFPIFSLFSCVFDCWHYLLLVTHWLRDFLLTALRYVSCPFFFLFFFPFPVDISHRVGFQPTN